MITLADVRDCLKTLFAADHYYIGKLDNKQDRSLGVYSLKRSGAPVTAIGQESTYEIIGASLLIHWSQNARQTELAARQLYETLRTVKNLTINDHIVYMLELQEPEPVDVSTDDKGVFEFVVDLKIYYERK